MPSRRVTARSLRRGLLALGGIAAAILGTTAETENAVANGDTRALTIYHTHTQESATIVFKRDGRYDRAALDQLNWLLRDWRINEPTKMDPRLFDTVWEAYRQVGSAQPIHIVSAYRSPGTNAMLRRRSRMVAEFSQHMLGKAMDFYLPDVPIDRIREVGFQMSRGGVGWYPRANTPFIHMDVGSVRSWPRMSRDQLAHLFPDGKTVHLPPDGHPMPRYEEAKAEILARGGTVAGITTQLVSAEDEDSPGLMGLLAGLFGGSSAPQPVAMPAAPPSPRKDRRAPIVAVASADPDAPLGTKAALAYAAPGDPAGMANADARSLLTAERGPSAAPEVLPSVEAPLPPRRPADASLVASLDAAMVSILAPLPPRRPAEALLLPPSRPVALASLDGGMAHLAVAEPPFRATVDPEPVAPLARLVPHATLVAPDSDAAEQVHALFEAVAMGPVAAPAGREVPVHMATARKLDAIAETVGLTVPEPVSSRFSNRSTPDTALLGDRFTGAAGEPLRATR